MPILRALAVCGVVILFASACSSGGGEPSLTPPFSGSPSPATSPGLPAERVTFYGADAGDQAAAVVTGDFNGDAVTDVVVGASLGDGPDNSRNDSGEAYLFLGPFPEGGSLDASGGEYDAIFYGATAGDTLGRTLASGDFNGDGVDDLVMAAPAANEQAGAVYMMLGGKWPEQTDFAEADPDVLLRGGAGDDFAGLALASADVDSDSISELIIGALLADGPDGSRPDAGAVYVLRGQQLVAGDRVGLGSVSSVVYGARPGDHLGEALAAGDFNGDGMPDLILVATLSAGPDESRPGTGATYVLETPVTFPFDLATAAPRLTVFGIDDGDQLGHSIGAGDTNGDGAADLWLGAVSADGPGNQSDLAGEAELILGGPDRGGIFDSALGAPAATVFGPEAEARLGRSAAVGDLNGDGQAETLISAPNVASRSGRIYLFLGGRQDYPQDVSGADITLSGLDAGDILGHEAFGTPSLAVAAVAGDERPALLISAPGGDGPDNKRTDCGEVYMIPGSLLGS